MRANFAYERTKLTDVWPPGFAPSAIRVFARLPVDPLIHECENCKLRAACEPGRYARPECEEAVTQAPQPNEQPATDREDRYAPVIGALRAYGPQTVYDLVACGIGKYGTLRERLYELVAQGRVQSTRVQRNNTNVAFYSLVEER